MNLRDHARRSPGRSWIHVYPIWTLLPFLVRTALRLVYRLRITGVENVPRTGALIFVANHQSHLDPPLVACAVRDRPCAFMARASLFRFRPFGRFITALGAVPLRRGGSGSALRAAVGELEAGRAVLLFPEGGRTRDGVLARFQPGVLYLARRTNATVVPVALDGASDIWPKARSLPSLRGRLGLEVGTPQPAEKVLAGDDRAALERLRREIETMRLAVRARMRRETGGRWPRPGVGDVAYWEVADPVTTPRETSAPPSRRGP